MRTVVAFLSAVILASSAASARQAPAPALLIDHFVGNWVLQGTIDGKQTTHDVDAQWVLNHGYVRMHEVSREKDATGAPAYEAIVFISYDKKSGEYTCLWLDNTSNAGLINNGFGRGKPTGTTIPFLIKPTGGDVFHTSFIYAPGSDSWQWVMDGESGGKLQPFARVTLTRKK
jgi:hypothetical protein